ncbi:MAG TPA: hypothetical protein VHH35_21355 [Pyrinomonadaceae bacterium]|nr:hypothetical protein [Pyrinomonadaceae bacterium]
MRVIMGLVLLSLVTGSLVVAQQDDEATRKLWDTAFISRPGKKKTSPRRRSHARYRVATPNVPVDNVAPDSVVGVTIWRLRPARSADSGERLIVHDDDASKEWIPERISANTKLGPGDKLRVSVEAARAGYLYVIDREQYADGSLGEPYLIFPTKRTLNGDNKVSVGKLIEIPAQDDSPPFFTIRKSRPDQVAEVLSVLVTPTPLEGLEITDKAQKLTDAVVANWEKMWSTSVGRLDMESVGQSWTKEERDAGATNTRALTATAPAPQMLFYRPQSSEAIFVKLRLSYRR